jgi:hypothetical protein
VRSYVPPISTVSTEGFKLIADTHQRRLVDTSVVSLLQSCVN